MSGTPPEAKPRLFLDPNVLVSGVVFRGPEAELLDLAELGLCEVLTCDYVLTQLGRVLAGSFGVSKHAIDAVLCSLPVLACPDPAPSLVARATVLLRDPTDAPVLAGAWAARADALVSGDKDLLVLSAEQAGLPVLRTRAALSLVHSR